MEDELSSEVVLARVDQECSQEEVVVLEAKFEAVANLLGPLEAENVNLKKNLNKGYKRESRTRQSVDIIEEGGEVGTMCPDACLSRADQAFPSTGPPACPAACTYTFCCT